MQTNVRTSADFDWAYLHSLWPTMQAARNSEARRSGQCMFGARFQLPADATLATIAEELNATTQLLLDLATIPCEEAAARVR